jgi:multidrug efflux pump subunit AcrA (membrane-fusion protein)
LSVEAHDRDVTHRIAAGSLASVDNQIDQATGTVKLKAQFPNQDNALFPNQFVNVRLLVSTIRGAVIVPSAAIQRSPQATFVYVVTADNTVEIRTVTVQHTEGDRTAVSRGLQTGEQVVTDGVDSCSRARGSRSASRIGRRRRSRTRESVAAVHPAADRHVADHGRPGARRRRRLPPAAGLGAAAGGLSDD